jgi:hypothetical protein
VEIETTFGPDGSFDRIIEEFQRERLPIVDSRGTHLGSHSERWTVKRDGSVTGGCEVVSPPLDFNDPEERRQVDRAILCLQRAGCRPHVSCGTHVHVDGVNMTPVQLAGVCRFFWKFEDLLFRLASSGWNTIRPDAISSTGYARPLPEVMINAMKKVRDHEGLRKAWITNGLDPDESGNWTVSQEAGCKYHGVNLQSWWLRGTVEFRCFNSSLNPDRVQAYIAISMAIIRDAKKITSKYGRYTKRNYPLGWMLAQPDPKKAATKLLIRFQQIVRTTNGDTKSRRVENAETLMSKEDWKRVLMCFRDSVPQNPSGVYTRTVTHNSGSTFVAYYSNSNSSV